MNKVYNEPEIEIVHLGGNDIITASGCGGFGNVIGDEDTCPAE